MQRTPLFFTRLIASAAFALASFGTLAADTALDKVVVMTSYPEEVVSRFEAGFEKTHPGTRVEILWRHSGDARSYLRDQKQQNVDVYWSPAQRNFLTLAREGAFRKLDIDMTGLPARVGGFPISDPAGFYAATEIAGYGFAFNPQRLKEKGLPQPRQWTELSDQKWKDEIVFPIPGKVGFAPLLIDIILQGYGWDKGWEILQGIGSNAQLLGQGGQHISDEVSSGRASVGVSIDFFIKAAIANGAPIQFAYPGITGYSPAHVAIMKNAPHLKNARAFAAYVLSAEGQKILFHPDIRKLPVRPAVYANKPAGYFDPFKAASAMPFVFNTERALERQGLNNTLFDILITNEQTALRRVLDKIHQAENLANADSDSRLKARTYQARVLASTVPLSEVQAETIAGRFVSSFDATSDTQAHVNAALVSEWVARIRQNRAQAERIAQEVIDAAAAKK
ncbi:Putative regulatory lipoprotein [Herminiimonas arsenicoxydans]|uniref:Regulatory lipoprotein n=1 Tax=Herminiimonas arsenicoxydans TaxID=204773 RepID=A4GAL0_HERAR|nr:Putative regulatory lipoprotein [Herminiimonas arsenicoxydans]